MTELRSWPLKETASDVISTQRRILACCIGAEFSRTENNKPEKARERKGAEQGKTNKL